MELPKRPLGPNEVCEDNDDLHVNIVLYVVLPFMLLFHVAVAIVLIVATK